MNQLMLRKHRYDAFIEVKTLDGALSVDVAKQGVLKYLIQLFFLYFDASHLRVVSYETIIAYCQLVVNMFPQKNKIFFCHVEKKNNFNFRENIVKISLYLFTF